MQVKQDTANHINILKAKYDCLDQTEGHVTERINIMNEYYSQADAVLDDISENLRKHFGNQTYQAAQIGCREHIDPMIAIFDVSWEHSWEQQGYNVNKDNQDANIRQALPHTKEIFKFIFEEFIQVHDKSISSQISSAQINTSDKNKLIHLIRGITDRAYVKTYSIQNLERILKVLIPHAIKLSLDWTSKKIDGKLNMSGGLVDLAWCH